ncbi:isocitrate lyase/PEP mutase family protein [Longirhabdus pacifica]|uniref:isocitrate lyase/PEP mutase family protein n=1 Tax=Longirhabdus pacifica TaxID=2305227 RepID=UPI001008B003|nr:isocitrate lyase/phosphoenolpyruvate mutase family protein [Longirhabdus pacifica]
MNTKQKVKHFRGMHQKNKPIVLLNIWSVESAEALASHHIKLIPTGSYAMADYYGYEDGENMPFEEIVTYIKQMQPSKNYITVDIESGYAKNLHELEKNITTLIENGVVGINIEDKIKGTGTLHSAADQCEKIACIREVCKKMNSDMFINVRTDTYFTGNITENNANDACLEQTLSRIRAYSDAGADCIFIPGLNNSNHILNITNNSTVPINVMLDIKKDTIMDYFNLGVARISFGPSLYFLYQEYKDKNMNYFYEDILRHLNRYQIDNQIELLMT